MVQPGNWFSWVEFAAEFQRISSLTRATVEPSPAGAVRLEADAQRQGEMDPDSKSVSRNQWEEHTDPTYCLPSPPPVMSLSLLHPDAPWDKGRKNGEGKENKRDCFKLEETNFFSTGSFPPGCSPATKQDALTTSEPQ